MAKQTKKKKGFDGNPLLKPHGEETKWTEELVQEFIKCRDDPFYFIENYVVIKSLDAGLVKFKLRPYQRKIIQHYLDNRFCLTEAGRQLGKTQTTSAFLLHKAVFTRNQSVFILANKGDTSTEVMDIIKQMYESLPRWMQVGVKKWNERTVVLGNKSKIRTSTTTGSGIRGKAVNVLYIDECAIIPQKLWDKFFNSVYPTISSGSTTQLIMSSTPLGMNHWHKLTAEAIRGAENGGNSFRYLLVPWNAEGSGRDERFKKETISNIGLKAWNQDYECMHLGSADTLIDPYKLGTFAGKQPLSTTGAQSIYEEPQEDHKYIICADTAFGKGESGDFSAQSVFDVTTLPYRQVAVFRDNQTSTIQFAEILYTIGMRYNEAWIATESNIRDVGTSLIKDLAYPNMIYSERRGAAGIVLYFGANSNKSDHGVLMTGKSKRSGCLNLKMLLENDTLLVSDYETISEIQSFVKKGESWAAESGQHDDLAISLVLFAIIAATDDFKEWVKADTSQIFLGKQSTNKQPAQLDMSPIFCTYAQKGTHEEIIDGEVWTVTENWQQSFGRR